MAILLVLLLVLPIGADAATSGTCGENLTWTLDDEGTLTITGEGSMTDYWTPYYVICWGTNVQKVIIEQGITSIGNGAFAGCHSLTSVDIPDSVTSIGGGAFSGCSSRAGVIIPESVTRIEERAFAGCSGLKRVVIPTGLISTLPAALEVIEGEAFANSLFTCVAIQDKCTRIETNAFANSRLLQFVEIPASVMDIDPVAFSGFGDQLVIITTAGSYAETFAAEHGIICIAR